MESIRVAVVDDEAPVRVALGRRIGCACHPAACQSLRRTSARRARVLQVHPLTDGQVAEPQSQDSPAT